MFDLTRNQRDHTCRKRTCLLPSVAYVMFHLKGWSCRENEVSEGSERFHSDRKAIWRGTLGHPEQRTLWKRCITVRPTVALYLDELLIQKCKFGIQFSRHWPQLGLPQLALWHHVGVTIGITLDKNGSLYDPAGTESWNMQKDRKQIY